MIVYLETFQVAMSPILLYPTAFMLVKVLSIERKIWCLQ